MSSVDEITKKLLEISRANQPLQLVNAYRGIPISTDAQIVTISQGYVALQVDPLQAACLAIEGQTYITSSLLTGALQANVVAVDILQNQAILADFRQVGHPVGGRVRLRVQPQQPLEVEIYAQERRIPGKVADISVHGLGIFAIDTHIYGDFDLREEMRVVVDVRLPPDDTIVRLQGKIASVSPAPEANLKRLGLVLEPEDQTVASLEAYLRERRGEILHELGNIYETMRQERLQA